MKYDNVLLKDKADLTEVVLSKLPEVQVLGAYEKPDVEGADDIKVLSVKFSKIGKITLDRYKNLEWIVCRSHGVDMVNIEMVRKRNIGVVSLSPTSKPCANWIHHYMDEDDIPVIFGNGSISRELQKKLDTFYIVDSKTTREEIDDYLDKCNTVVSTLPYTKYTTNYFDRDFFSKIDKPIKMISLSRGELIDNSALLEFSTSDNLKLGVFDMLVKEGRNVLSKRDNIRYTEHTAWSFNQPMENGKLSGYVNEEFSKKLKSIIDDCLNNEVEHPHLPRQERIWF